MYIISVLLFNTTIVLIYTTIWILYLYKGLFKSIYFEIFVWFDNYIRSSSYISVIWNLFPLYSSRLPFWFCFEHLGHLKFNHEFTLFICMKKLIFWFFFLWSVFLFLFHFYHYFLSSLLLAICMHLEICIQLYCW